MVMKTLILIFFFEIEESKITSAQLHAGEETKYVRKFSFPQSINVWNKLSTQCAYASSINMFNNIIDNYLVKAGYT